MISFSLVVFIISFYFESIYQVVILAPIYEEFLKFSLFYCFIISYINGSKVSSARVFIVFILLLMVFAVGDILNPMNNSDSLFLILKSFISHFGFTVIGGMVFVFLYKYSIRLGIILALFTSISLHSIANYLFYLDGFQNLYCLFIGLIGIILLVKFIGYKH